MFLGRLSHNPAWMEATLGLSAQSREKIAHVSRKSSQLKQMIFVRWTMVMYEFEKRLYADPDQDLNGLWEELIARYQMIDKLEGRDKPDCAVKIHFNIAPCYYHNYVLREFFASQLHLYIAKEELKLVAGVEVSYVDQPQVERFLRRRCLPSARCIIGTS